MNRENTVKKLNKMLQYTSNALLCVLGAVVFLFVFYVLAYRTPVWDIWLPTNMDNDEVLYNRQVVSILTHGGPQGYFGYDESHAALGRFGGWGPILIWAYALPGFLFGSSYSTMLWCNILFGVVGLALFARAARLNVWQMIVSAGGLVCLWMPLTLLFCGSSESLHNALALVAVGASAALARRQNRGWFVLAAVACAFLTISRPYALLLWAFPLTVLWKNLRWRNTALALALLSFVVGLFNMTALTAPYFEGLGLDLTALSMARTGIWSVQSSTSGSISCCSCALSGCRYCPPCRATSSNSAPPPSALWYCWRSRWSVWSVTGAAAAPCGSKSVRSSRRWPSSLCWWCCTTSSRGIS